MPLRAPKFGNPTLVGRPHIRPIDPVGPQISVDPKIVLCLFKNPNFKGPKMLRCPFKNLRVLHYTYKGP